MFALASRDGGINFAGNSRPLTSLLGTLALIYFFTSLHRRNAFLDKQSSPHLHVCIQISTHTFFYINFSAEKYPINVAHNNKDVQFDNFFFSHVH